jgi:hypothetical protein
MRKTLFVLASLLIMSTNASAVYTYATNEVRTSVIYDSITADDVLPGNTLPLWGNLQFNGDQMWFFPTNFEAQAQDGADLLVDETLQFTMHVKPGQAENRVIDSISFIEYGDYTLNGTGTDDTSASVTAAVTINIQEVSDGSGGSIPTFMAPIFTSLTYTPSNGDYYLNSDGEATLATWQGFLNYSLAGLDVTKVSVSIDNTLLVESELGTTSRIEKKGLGENPAVSISPVIPEPATLALLGLGGVLLRRKK